MIEVRHLSKQFGKTKAVNDISFSVEKGEHFVLLGTSGCGKTTTLKMINRLIEPSSGEVWINGENSNTYPPELLRRKMGYVFQNIGLFPHYTIEENISVVPNLLKWDKKEILLRGEILLDKFSLPPQIYLRLYPSQLSGGQQQRVGFTRALMADPPVLLMDEPLGALDPITRHQMRREFNQLDELKGKTIIMVTHDIPEAIELGDRICLMDQGKIQQIGTATELLLHPANDFVKQFFAHDQFMLQLQALQVKDLLEFIHPVDNPANENQLSINTSIMNAIEQISSISSSDKRITFWDGKNNQYYRIGLSDLLKGFQEKIKLS